jgi:tight adherence protein C
MFPPWLRLTLYIAAGVAGLWLLFRLWQARRASRTPTSAVPRRLVAAPPQPQPQTPAVPTAPIAAVTTHAHATSPEPASWDQKTLFEEKPAIPPLPRVLAADVPITRQDDLAFGPLTSAFAELLPESDTRQEEARRELQAAGYYAPHALLNFAAVRYLLMMAGLIVAGVALVLVPQRLEWMAVISLVALPLLGWAAPRLYVRSRAAERRSEIERGMPDLLDMLNMCVSQGLTIPDSLSRILPDLSGPYPALAQELRIVTEQATIGTWPVALDNFSHRIDIPEVHSFASLLTQTERMGTSISDALVSYSDTMRESLRQRADEKGNRAAFRLLFPTVLCLMPAVYLFLLGPAIIELSNFFYSGGRDALDRGTPVIERINQQRAGSNRALDQ